MFGWKQWDKHLLHFKSKDIDILEIGVFKGYAMEKFAKVFLETNKNAEYYGIDTWEDKPMYNDVNFKEIEKIAKEKRDKSPVKDRIHFIHKEARIALPELLLKEKMFDIIFIDSSHTAKNVLFNATISLKLLKKNGVLIFDDYLWSRLEPNIFTPKPAIDSILNLYADEIKVLYIGYQVIIKKTDFNFVPKIKDSVIIGDLIDALDYYWFDTEMKEVSLLFNLKEVPKFKLVTDKSSNIKLRELENMNIFSDLKIEDFMYPYYALNDIKDEFKINLRNHNVNTKIINILSSYSQEGIYGLRYYKYMNIDKCITTLKIFANNADKFINSEKTLNEFINNKDNTKKNNSDIIFDGFNLNKYFNENSIDKLIEDLNKEDTKYNCMTGFNTLKHGYFDQMYNLILMQMIIIRNKLNLNGEFQIDISERYDFINDFILLLNILFKKVVIYKHSNKVGRLNIYIICKEYNGMTDDIYNMIIDSLKEHKKDEIINIFDLKHNYLDIKSLENIIFNISKKIIKIIENNTELITMNKNKIINSIIKRTVNDVYNYSISL